MNSNSSRRSSPGVGHRRFFRTKRHHGDFELIENVATREEVADSVYPMIDSDESENGDGLGHVCYLNCYSDGETALSDGEHFSSYSFNGLPQPIQETENHGTRCLYA